MIRALLIDSEGEATAGGEELIARWRGMPEARLWVDMQGESTARERALLEEFGCHRMPIDAGRPDRHPPKIEEFEGHSVLVDRIMGYTGADLSLMSHLWSVFSSERDEVSTD